MNGRPLLRPAARLLAQAHRRHPVPLHLLSPAAIPSLPSRVFHHNTTAHLLRPSTSCRTHFPSALSHLSLSSHTPVTDTSPTSTSRRHLALSPYPPRRPRRRPPPRITAGISKPSSHLRHTRRFSTSSSSSSDSSNHSSTSASTSTSTNPSPAVTWRTALNSPRNAMLYANHLRRDIVDWAKHMWAGAKLLAFDVRGSSKILKKVVRGKQVSRRERNFIVQTGVDLARLVPFSLFLIIPLAEFALPFALRFFPNMLPSQFQNQMKEEENLKRRLKGRLQLAKYLSEVVEEKAKLIKASDSNSELKKDAEDLTTFLNAIRDGKDVTDASVSRFAKFFNDELTIDGVVRPQLVAMCKYMGISPYGHDIFLRFKLRSRLNAIKRDDMQIMWEGGVNSLTDSEVAKACRDRGIREEVSNKWMRKQLSDWLHLSQRQEIPGSLLIMSRAFLYTRTDGQAETNAGIAETLGSMPEDVIMDVKQAADVGEGSNVERLEESRRQAKLIEIESEREARKEKEDEEKRKKKELEEEELAVEEAAASVGEGTISDKEVMQKVEAREQVIKKEMMEGAAEPGVVVEKEDEKEEEVVDEEEEFKEQSRMREMLESLGELSSDSSVEKEREELRNLKLQLVEAEELVKGTDGESSADMRRFKNLVSKLEREIERVDAKVGLRMKLLDKDNDGVMSMRECEEAMKLIAGEEDEDVVAETLQRLDADADGNISKADLARLLHELQSEYGIIEEKDEGSGGATEVVETESSVSSPSR